jgi:hypothetical protein
MNPIAAQRVFPPAVATVFRSEPPTSASEKAQELRKRAEEAKRKAEELKKVAEQKAEAVMVAVKKANEMNDDPAATASIPIMAPPATPLKIEASSSEKSSTRATNNNDVGSAIIPINSENVEFTSGILGGALALALGASPVLAIVAAAAANYISKKEDLGELNEFIQAISKASLNSVNFLARLDAKYTILGKISESLDKSISDLKKSDEGTAETFKKIEDSVKQIQQLADEIDLLEGGKQALGAVGDVLETSIDKAVDANEEYKLTERAAEAAKKAIEKAKAASS